MSRFSLIHAIGIVSLAAVPSSASACETVYYRIELPAKATKTTVQIVKAEVGSYSALASRDDSDRKALAEDNTVSAADKAYLLPMLDSNIRVARCWAATSGN